LECRSRLGSFDFDLQSQFHRDPTAAKGFSARNAGNHIPGRFWLESMMDRRGDGVTVQAFFNGSSNVEFGDGGTLISQSEVKQPIIIGEASGTIGAIGNKAHGHVNVSSLDDVLAHPQQALVELRTLSDVAGAAGNDQLATEADAAVQALEQGQKEAASNAFIRLGWGGLSIARSVGLELLVAIIEAQIGIK
jgi:hypothetical protein